MKTRDLDVSSIQRVFTEGQLGLWCFMSVSEKAAFVQRFKAGNHDGVAWSRVTLTDNKFRMYMTDNNKPLSKVERERVRQAWLMKPNRLAFGVEAMALMLSRDLGFPYAGVEDVVRFLVGQEQHMTKEALVQPVICAGADWAAAQRLVRGITRAEFDEACATYRQVRKNAGLRVRRLSEGESLVLYRCWESLRKAETDLDAGSLDMMLLVQGKTGYALSLIQPLVSEWEATAQRLARFHKRGAGCGR